MTADSQPEPTPHPSDAAPAISLRGVSKHFARVRAVDHVDLDIAPGEFFALLGPSGSGKTTMLRLIAGFELPTSGTILLGGVDVTRRPPFDRDVNTVFQDYALFPHMTVARNVEYGLKVRKVARDERRRRVEAALHSVRLDEFAGRMPQQLSGGQRQRVALARALVNRPRVLLLDEPLGALDLKLREEMQVELKEIQREAGITFVFVTHDQGEALTMSDRIAVFHRGRIEQVGTPTEMYERPTSEFVASFVGTSNVLSGEFALSLLGVGGTHAVRPERARVVDAHAAPVDRESEVELAATLREIQYLGGTTRLRAALTNGDPFVIDTTNVGHDPALLPQRGATIRIAFARSAAFEIRPTTEFSQMEGATP